MYDFFGDPTMNNNNGPKDSNGEKDGSKEDNDDDLTRLALWSGSSKKKTKSSPVPPTPSPSSSMNLTTPQASSTSTEPLQMLNQTPPQISSISTEPPQMLNQIPPQVSTISNEPPQIFNFIPPQVSSSQIFNFTPPQVSLISTKPSQILNPLSLLVPSSNNNPNLNTLSVSYSAHNPNPASNRNPSQTPNTLSAPSSSVENNNPQNASNMNENAPMTDVDVPEARVSSRRPRRPPSKGIGQGRSATVPPPFPWATNRRATIHSHQYLMQNNIFIITGKVQCKRCDQEFDMSLNLVEKVQEVSTFIRRQKGNMHDRAPAAWSNPVLLRCAQCGRENCAKPILVNTKKKAINWLFLFLSQTVGCCTLEQLRYFCKHTSNHRTGAKDRLVYLAYMTLFQQLFPEWLR